jgi:hypothetical protein
MGSIGAPRLLAMLAIIAAMPSSTSAAETRALADALPPQKASCHAQIFDAAKLAAHPNRRVAAIAIERTAQDLATERKWGKLEQFDSTPVVSATLRVRLRGDPAKHSARLECAEISEGTLVCMTRACAGGEIYLGNGGSGAITVSIGGTLEDGRFIGHYIHLDESCEARPGGPIVLESGEDDRRFTLTAAPKEACR